jgi:hypothetical protein
MLRTQTQKLLSLQLCQLLAFGDRFRHRLAVHLCQLWLRIERLKLRGTAGLIEEDDPLRLGRMMQA